MSNGISSSGPISLNPSSAADDGNDGDDAVSDSEARLSFSAFSGAEVTVYPRISASFSLRLFASFSSCAS